MKMEIPSVFLGLAVVVTLLTTGCEKANTRAEWWAGERERLRLVNEIKLQEYRYKISTVDEYRDFENLKESIRVGGEKLRELTENRFLIISKIRSLEQNLELQKEDLITIVHITMLVAVKQIFEQSAIKSMA